MEKTLSVEEKVRRAEEIYARRKNGNISTSRGPATTMPFAYQLVELLGKDSSALKEGMLYNSLCDYFKNKV